MSSDHDRYKYPSLEARRAFARTLTAWTVSNGWVHSTLHEWGEQAGFPAVRDSSYNRLQNAKTEQPSPLTFIQLALANARIAARDYSGVVDGQLMSRLAGSKPITDADGRPWGAMEFFGHFVGELPAPESLELPRIPTAEEAAAVTQAHQQKFQKIASDKGLTQALAWRQFEKLAVSLTKSQRETLRDVFAGWHVWTPDELQALCADGCNSVDEALEVWEELPV